VFPLSIQRNEDVTSNDYDIVIYDLKTKKETMITNESGLETDPIIYENYICWEKNLGDDGLFLHDLSTKETRQIVPQGARHDIYGHYIVFRRSSLAWADGGISLYDIKNDKTYKISTENEMESNIDPKIYKNHIVY